MRKTALIIASFLIFGTSVSFAGNVDTFGIGAKATALGGAFSAYADDAFAAYYNPAGLSQIDRIKLSGGVQMLDPNLNIYDYQVAGGPGAAEISDTSDNLFVPHLGAAWPISDTLSAGVAVYVPYGLDIMWEDDPGVNPAAYDCRRSYYFREVITPAISYRFNNRVSAGLGVSLGRSETGIERYSYKYNLATLGTQELKTETEMKDDFNYSFNLGLMVKPVDNVSLGLTYRSRTETDFEGEMKAITSTGTTTTHQAKTSIDHPEQIQAGIRYQPHEKLSLEFDYVWTNWSIIDRYDVDLAPALLGVSRESFERHWDDTNQIRFGVEWTVNDLLTLRGGYFYDPSPIGDHTFDIQWPDADKKTYSLGCGLNFGKFSIDAVVQYAVVESERYIGGESERLNDDYNGSSVSMHADGDIWGMGLTFNYSI